MEKSLLQLLLIEQNPHIRNVLKQYLKTDFLVTVATTGPEAIQFLNSYCPFDFVITELNVHSINGLEIIRIIRRNKFYSHLPILVLAEAFDTDMRIACLELGADGCLTKPFNPLEVKAKIEATLRLLERNN